jgi:K+-transporting ATPase ATPase C chain
MLSQLRPAFVLLVIMTVLTGLAYPLAITGLAQLMFPHQAGGSLVERGGIVIGSELIGQNVTDAKYFHGRPSATSAADPNDPARTVPAPYNAASSTGSNAGPTSRALIDRVRSEVEAWRRTREAPVPVDLVTSSGSGLDPHITPAAAEFQAPRVAAARDLPVERVQALVAAATEERFLGVFGERRVNVLKLNIALDALAAK